MEKFKILYPKAFRGIISVWSVALVIDIVVLFMFKSDWICWIFLLCFFLPFANLLWVLPNLIFDRNALSRYKITEKGVENGHLLIKFEDIKDYKVFYPERRKRSIKIIYPQIVCFGVIRDGSFFKQRRKECVFIPITQENLELIKKYCTVENPTINELMSQFYGFGDYYETGIQRWSFFD